MADPLAVEAFTRLVDIMSRLRAPGGCPWDREQTPDTLRQYVLEEACEVLDAIDDGDPRALCEELGDLLLQVVFQAEIAAEAGRFTIADVARGIADKLVRRHPHVFADVSVRDADEVIRNWKEQKAAERRAAGKDDGIVANVPRSLPALARAQAVGDKLGAVGFDWPDTDAVLDKLREEQHELEDALGRGDTTGATRELGDVLLTVTSLARHLGASAELALREAIGRLEDRVRHVERAAVAEGTSIGELDAAARDRLWATAKTAV